MTPRRLLIAAGCAALLAGLSGAGALAQGRTAAVADVQQTTEESSYGFTLSPPENKSPEVTAEEAVASARSGPTPVGDQPATAVLAHVVWKPGGLDQDAWVVTIKGACTRMFGGMPSSEGENAQLWAVGEDIFLIDASKGTGLLAASEADPSLDASSCAKDPTGNSIPTKA